eukprot:scaffold658_cov110-Skeletonema_marinoi.AAC.3
MPHQVTFDVVATLIRTNNASAVKKMLLYYHGQLSWVARSCGLPYSQREIQYCAREYYWRSSQSQMPHQVTYDVVTTQIRTNNASAVKKMLLYYHGQLSWVIRSCGLPCSQREIRYGCQQRSLRSSQMPHQVIYDKPTNT